MINNAVHYGYKAVIHLNCLQNKLEITITDQGPGLPEADLEHVFLPFTEEKILVHAVQVARGLD